MQNSQEPEARGDRGRRRRPGRRRHGVRGLEDAFELSLDERRCARQCVRRSGPRSVRRASLRQRLRPRVRRRSPRRTRFRLRRAWRKPHGCVQLPRHLSSATLHRHSLGQDARPDRGFDEREVGERADRRDGRGGRRASSTQAVKSGRITQAMADQIEANLKSPRHADGEQRLRPLRRPWRFNRWVGSAHRRARRRRSAARARRRPLGRRAHDGLRLGHALRQPRHVRRTPPRFEPRSRPPRPGPPPPAVRRAAGAPPPRTRGRRSPRNVLPHQRSQRGRMRRRRFPMA